MTQQNLRSNFMYNPEDWKKPNDEKTSEYSITIPFNKHCGGDCPVIQVYYRECGKQDFQNTDQIAAVFINASNDITLTTPVLPTFEIKVVII